MLVKLKQLVLFYNPAADADTPFNLMVHQNGRLNIEINRSPTATPPSMEYQITTTEDICVGILVLNPPYTFTSTDIRVSSVINIYLVARSTHFFSGVLAPYLSLYWVRICHISHLSLLHWMLFAFSPPDLPELIDTASVAALQLL